MTQAQLVANFESIAAALHDVAPSEKARAFADKIAGAIRARGAEWIAANEFALHITFSAEEQEDLTPVEDNRLWYIAEWQLALAK